MCRKLLGIGHYNFASLIDLKTKLARGTRVGECCGQSRGKVGKAAGRRGKAFREPKTNNFRHLT